MIVIERPLWKKVFGIICDCVSLRTLRFAEEQLELRYSGILQGKGMVPLHTHETANDVVLYGDVITFFGMCEGLYTCQEIDEFTWRISNRVISIMGEPDGIKYFYNWYDEVPIEVMYHELQGAINDYIANIGEPAAIEAA